MQYGLPEKYAGEIAFIREIMFDVEDDTPRMIYADWLSERNDPRADLLRLDIMLRQTATSDTQYDKLQQQWKSLVQRIDPQWVSLLARSPIELCPQKLEFKFLCPKIWENLQPFGDDQLVRYCDQCGRSVRYCLTIAEARQEAVRGQCVAVDPGVARLPDDLTRPTSVYQQELFLGTIAEP